MTVQSEPEMIMPIHRVLDVIFDIFGIRDVLLTMVIQALMIRATG